MTWRPVHSQHAIELVRLTIRFSEQVPAKLSRKMSDAIGAKRSDLRFVGPEPRQTIGFQLVQAGASLIPQQHTTIQGWMFSRKASNGVPLEAIILEGDLLTYETSEYQRWPVFCKRLNSVSSGALALSSSALDIKGISLEYQDRFIFQGISTEARVDNLLTSVVGDLHDEALSGNSLWHSHRGWFETVDGRPMLVNQNFDANDGSLAGQTVIQRSVQILTRAELRDAAVDGQELEQSLNKLHAVTDRYFRAAVKPQYLRAVGIE